MFVNLGWAHHECGTRSKVVSERGTGGKVVFGIEEGIYSKAKLVYGRLVAGRK